MKQHAVQNEVLTNSNNESKFTINASAQAFKILSDGIYEHKVAAMVRELSFNAYDSHVEAGKEDQPFRVVLPNELHSYFEIEDYGVGLDDDGVRTVYTSYFTSTKTDTNDAVGAFGLGSKTPFAYTSTFTIQARKDGIERHYNAYLGSDGAPSVNMMFEKKTEESNGVKITVPVKDHDRPRFFNEASWVLSFFKVRPTVNDPQFKFFFDEDMTDELEEKGIAVRNYSRSPSDLYQSFIYAVMGGVCYSISNDIVRRINDSYLRNIVMRSSQSRVFINFPIGELEVAASRETLSYDERTEQNLISRFSDVVEQLKIEDALAIKTKTHPVHAIKYIIDKYALGSMILSSFDYKGKTLYKYYNRQFDIPYSELSLYKHSTRYTKSTVRKESDTVLARHVADANKVKAIYYEKDYKKTGIVKHSRLLCPNDRSSIVLTFEDPITEHQRKKIDKLLGVDIEWHNLKDLREAEKKNAPKPTKGPSSPGVKLDDTIMRAVTFIKSTYGLRRRSVDRIDVSSGNYFYAFCRSSHNEILYGTKGQRLSHSLLLWIMKATGNEHATIIVRNSMNESKIDKNNIPPVDDMVKKFFDEKTNTKYITLSMLSNQFSWVNGTFSNSIVNILHKAKSEKVDHLFKEIERQLDMTIAEASEYMSNSAGEVHGGLFEAFDSLYDKPKHDKVVNEITMCIDKVERIGKKEYELLDICNFQMHRYSNEFAKYVQFVDKAKSVVDNS